MNANVAKAKVTSLQRHPNEVDRRRIERALESRKRYRYVTPEVQPDVNGYLIQSSCCSRNVDPDGGVIDIARIEYRAERGCWWLYHKDHQIDHWIMHGEYATLPQVIELLNQDPNRRFWQ
ncbi:DUF3024 domain-containing protein [Methylolobus aquaticus]|nr:DUF3024 domain-containing protein [Methylolobus aquaticus]